MTFQALFGRPFAPPFGPALASVSGVTTLIYDTFTDTTGTSLDAHTIAPTNTPATAWIERVGNWSISAAGKAVLAASANTQYATLNAGVSDCTLSCLATSNTTSSVARLSGLVARWSDPANYWRIGINDGGNHILIVEIAGGVATTRASTSVAIDTGVEYTVQAVLSGATITATVNGGSTATYASAILNQTATIHGILARETADSIDNFTVTVP